MSLLGLIRHMAGVEHHWFCRTRQRNLDTPRLYWSAEEHDLDFDGAVAAPDVVQDAFEVWQGQIAAADEWLDAPIDLGDTIGMTNGDQASVRDILFTWLRSTPGTAATRTCSASASADAPVSKP